MRARVWLLWILAFAALTLISVSVEYIMPVHNWVLHISGSDDVSGPEYGWWSGFGSVFPWSVNTVVAFWILIWHHMRKNNCHMHGCWRIGTLPVGDPPYMVCKKHHFQATGHKVTLEHLKFHHKLSTRKKLLDAGFTPGPKD